MVDKLEIAITDNSSAVRRAVVDVLDRYWRAVPDRMLPVYNAALKDEDPEVRKATRDALTPIKKEESAREEVIQLIRELDGKRIKLNALREELDK